MEDQLAAFLERWSPAAAPVERPRPARARCVVEGETLRYSAGAGWLAGLAWGGGLGNLARNFGILFSAAFVLAWWVVWTGGCGFLIHKLATNPGWFMIAGAVPFLAVWLLVGAFIAYQLFGRERLELGPEGLGYELRVFFCVTKRRLPITELKGIEVSDRPITHWGHLQYWLEWSTLTWPIRLRSPLRTWERLWITDCILRRLHEVSPDATRMALPSPPEKAETLDPLSRTFPRPVESRLEPIWGLNELELRAPGGWPGWKVVLFLTFMNAFWNGIILMVVVSAWQKINWPWCLFVVPHQLIGAGILTLWTVSLLSPLQRTSWSFRPREVVERKELLGFGFTRNQDLSGCRRLELAPVPSRLASWAMDPDGRAGRFGLRLLGPHENHLFTFRPLHEGEVRWMAQDLSRLFRLWRLPIDQGAPPPPRPVV
jgi:hypothetical protein